MSSVVVKHSTTPLNHPPGPKANWLVGTVSRFQKNPLGTMEQLVNELGPAVRFRFFAHFHGYIFVHPDHNRHILQDNNKNYTKMPHPTFMILRPLAGNGLLTSDGEFWRRQRRLAQPAFHRKRINNFGVIMAQAAQDMVERWLAPAHSTSLFDVEQEMSRMTLEVAGQTLFSRDLTREATKVGQAFTDVSHEIVKLTSSAFGAWTIRMPFVPSTKRIHQQVSVLDEVVNRIIQERRQNPDESHEDLLGMFMEARDEETGAMMDDKQLRDEVATMLIAGHETTAVTLGWVFYFLSQHPDVREKLEEELTRVLSGRVPTIEDLPHLIYTYQVIDEAMRIYPPAYVISRWGQEPDNIGGYDVPANAVLALSPYLTHRLEEFWPEPLKFDPERFAPGMEQSRPRYAYIPFGGGPRQCIGNSFALTEAALTLATVCQQVRLELPAGQKVEMEPLITLRPRGLHMRLSKRQ
jgi:cytochrome P450